MFAFGRMGWIWFGLGCFFCFVVVRNFAVTVLVGVFVLWFEWLFVVYWCYACWWCFVYSRSWLFCCLLFVCCLLCVAWLLHFRFVWRTAFFDFWLLWRSIWFDLCVLDCRLFADCFNYCYLWMLVWLVIIVWRLPVCFVLGGICWFNLLMFVDLPYVYLVL